MQKNMLLNLVGVAALTLLCACGDSVKKEEVQPAAQEERAAEATTAMGEMPESSVQSETNNVAVAQSEVPCEVTPESETTQQVATADVPAEDQKA